MSQRPPWDNYCVKRPRLDLEKKQGRIHGYLSRVRLGRGSNKSLQASKQQNPRSKIDVMDQQTNGPMDQQTDQLK